MSKAPKVVSRRSSGHHATRAGAARSSSLIDSSVHAVCREQLAEVLFSGMSDEQFDGFVTGLDAVLRTIRQELSKLKQGRP